MARRRYYYRRPIRVVAAKKKWASNFLEDQLTSNVNGYKLVENTSSTGPSPMIVKTGNFKVQGDAIVTNGGGSFRARVFILYVPEGTVSIASIPTVHPEWIMGWTVLDVTQGTGEVNKFSITSRLKRNLNTGDSIYLFATTETTSASNTWEIHFCAQYFTCAN